MPSQDGDYKEYFNLKSGEKALEDTILPQENIRAIKRNKDAFAGFESGNV